MQVSTAIILYVVGVTIVVMPKVSELALRLVSAPFLFALHLAGHETRTLLPTIRFFAAKMRLISSSHTCRTIKVFMAMVAIQELSKSDSSKCGLAFAFASLVWALVAVVGALACIARNRFCCAATSEDAQLESHDNAAPEADTRVESSVPRIRQNRDLQPSLAVPSTDALPTKIGRPAGLSYTEDTTMENVPDINFTGASFAARRE
ncbi:hypothetical protein MTO96_043382 [Rhipicephalus appendiculatus]